MAIATGAQAQLTYIPEVTWGTTPGTPAMKVLPVAAASIKQAAKSSNVETLRGDRQVEDYFYGARQATLDIDYILRGEEFNALWEMAFFGTEAAGEIVGGVTRKSATFELMHTDIGQYEVIRGAMCTSLTITIGEDGYLRCKQSFIGKTYGISGTSLDATPDAANLAGIQRMAAAPQLNGANLPGCVGVELMIENNLEALWPVYSRDPAHLFDGRQRVTWKLSILKEDATQLSQFLGETSLTNMIVTGAGSVASVVLTSFNLKSKNWEAPIDGEKGIVQKVELIALAHANGMIKAAFA